MPVARVDGVDLHYRAEGAGVPCLVPRPVNTSVMERALSARLRGHLRLVFFDFRTSGRSGGTAGDFTLERLIDDVEVLRRALGVDRVALFGWSMLVLFAIDVAKALPDSISHLILVGGPVHLGERDDRHWEMLASPERKALLAQNNARLDQAALAAMPPERAVPLWYAANAPRYFYDPTFDPLPLYAGEEWDMTFHDRLLAELQPRHPDATAVEGLEVPIFLAEGVWDFGAPPTPWHDVVKTYPNCAYHAFERSGHYPFLEEQELFDAHLIDWLARGAAGQPGGT